jgi:hypothetical protein
MEPLPKAINDETFKRFLQIQSDIEKYERQGVFES